MKILLEGPDCAGKTTLAEQLTSEYNPIYVHNIYEPDDNRYLNQIISTLDLVKSSPDNIIMDRFLPSEVVYGSVLRNSYRYIDNTTYLRDMLESFDKIIFCIPRPKESYLALFEYVSSNREEMVNDTNIMSTIYDEYIIFINNLQIKYPDLSNKITEYNLFDHIKK